MLQGRELMADKNYGLAFPSRIAHPPQAFFLKVYVTYCQDFVNEKNIRVKMGCNGKRQPQILEMQ